MLSMLSYRKLALVGLATVLACASVQGAERRPERRASKQPAEQVELFAAIASGQLEVKMVLQDSTEGRVLVTNKTKQPLRVQLPEAFAAMPALAQIGGAVGAGGMAAGVNAGGGGAQAAGGGMGGFGGPGGVGAGGGFFNIPAEKTGRIEVPLVCLEHGKKEPRPAIPYTIKPIEQFSSDPILRELLANVGRGHVDQRAAQAAAWHLSNKMSWSELASKQIERLSGPNEPYFTREQLRAATDLVSLARRAAAERSESTTPAESASPGEQSLRQGN